ncbi:acyl-protein thioesterase 1 [Selaginella moellendorffii]|uniref:acyl-protein thioesterase 1 n=1 Tax=Selaginella moellendorffii TaxID=88036 RepID=UPI000D1C67A5|nr:acyl-protein thioesterase 1 [Selaginella moellendorffii]|eukprot:XP_002966628.2 acyl-protein thioesterase 1 [Selaginella moellendorffii]
MAYFKCALATKPYSICAQGDVVLLPSIVSTRHRARLLRSRREFPVLRGRRICGISGMDAAGSSTVEPSQGKWGKTITIEPEGKHLVTVVWLHGLGDTGHGWASILKTLSLNNIRWIVPTAPVRPVTINNGYPCTAWFDVGSLSDEGPDDILGLDSSAAYVASFLSKEPADVKVAVGGFSMGGATSLYTAAHSVLGKYTDGKAFTRKIDAVMSLSGWLPAGKLLPKQVAETPDCLKLAAELPIFMAHGKNDFIVYHNFGEMSARALKECGFKNVTFKSYRGLDHSTTPEELDDLCEWIKQELSVPEKV